MKTSHISITEAKQNLGELLKRVAYGGERIAVEFRGKPQAALISWQEFQRLQEIDSSESETHLLDKLRSLRESIANNRTGTMPRSTAILQEIREGRLNELTDMR